jgi:hypothetical protein
LSAPEPTSTAADHPFIIWTLRRTGGTNLTRHLVNRSGLRGVEHEPFNPGRIFGHVTDAWKQGKDKALLAEQMRAVCARRNIIKHTVELAPQELSEALVECSAEFGYRHLFLYRRTARDRLLSLHFAQRSGVWGPKGAATRKVDETAVFGDALPAQKLADHERVCNQRLQKLWDALSRRTPAPIALAFEDVYAVPQEQAARALQPVLDGLGLARGAEEDAALLRLVTTEGRQGTHEQYERFDGTGELELALRKVPAFRPLPAA